MTLKARRVTGGRSALASARDRRLLPGEAGGSVAALDVDALAGTAAQS
ncbi:hypothetical protein WMF45_28665 [Sorangium sp. So ce448]